MALTKFYHYSLWFEDDTGRRINPHNALDDSVFSNDFYRLVPSGDKSYSLRFQEIDSGWYHGIIVRTKDESNLVRLTNDGSLRLFSDITEDEGEVGDIDLDYVDFGVHVENTGLSLLIEVGFQTPGIGVIENYLNEHLSTKDRYAIERETKIRDDTDEKLDRLLDQDLKKVEVSFKKNPTTYDELDASETLKSMIPDDYRLKFEVSVHRGNEVEKSKVRGYLSQFMSMIGFDDSTVEYSIRKIDFPKFMNTFRITGIDDEEEIEENIADIAMKEKIDTSQYGIFDSELGEHLREKMMQQ